MVIEIKQFLYFYNTRNTSRMYATINALTFPRFFYYQSPTSQVAQEVVLGKYLHLCYT